VSRRKFKCSCGSKNAELFSCGIGCYLFIYCDACKRTLDGPRIRLSSNMRGWDATPKQRAEYRDELRARWDKGESNKEKN